MNERFGPPRELAVSAVPTLPLETEELIADDLAVLENPFHSLSLLSLCGDLSNEILTKRGECSMAFPAKYLIFMVSAEGIEPSTY